jgi:hypothetical protein
MVEPGTKSGDAASSSPDSSVSFVAPRPIVSSSSSSSARLGSGRKPQLCHFRRQCAPLRQADARRRAELRAGARNSAKGDRRPLRCAASQPHACCRRGRRSSGTGRRPAASTGEEPHTRVNVSGVLRDMCQRFEQASSARRTSVAVKRRGTAPTTQTILGSTQKAWFLDRLHRQLPSGHHRVTIRST